MNVFEDLIIELKEENLLESTVMEVGQPDDNDPYHFDESEVPNIDYDLPEYIDDDGANSIEIEGNSDYHAVDSKALPSETILADDYGLQETVVPELPKEPAQGKRSPRGKEFFKKRAMGEVSSLQMVEHVLTGVEREYMKVVPKTFDDFNAKKALHSFLQIEDGANSEEHAAAEFALMRETEAWCSALAERDRDVPVSSLRQYCENSRPALSSQALLGLGRFYRNLPYSESVRSKFDFVITRLFSRPVAFEKRVCLFTRDEILTHINTLYSEWSSISLYAADDDQSNVMLTALSFEDLSIEAENASTFDQLIESDFFGRLRLFKESISELFFAPLVTAAAIESNIRIGNAYVELIDRERRKMDAQSLQSKYGNHNDSAVSEATGRTLGLVDLLKDLSEAEETSETSSGEAAVAGDETLDDNSNVGHELHSGGKFADTGREMETEAKSFPPFIQKLIGIIQLERIKENARNVNKWFLAGCFLLIAASFGLYFYANYGIDDKVPTAGVVNVELDNSVLKEHIKVGKVAGGVFYGQLQPSWDGLSKDMREDYLKKVYQAGVQKGYRQVNLIGKDGKVVAFASPTRLDVAMP